MKKFESTDKKENSRGAPHIKEWNTEKIINDPKISKKENKNIDWDPNLNKDQEKKIEASSMKNLSNFRDKNKNKD